MSNDAYDSHPQASDPEASASPRPHGGPGKPPPPPVGSGTPFAGETVPQGESGSGGPAQPPVAQPTAAPAAAPVTPPTAAPMTPPPAGYPAQRQGGYAAQQPGGYPAQQPAGPGVQPGGYFPPVAPRPTNGVVPWALGFIVFFPLPFLGALASGVAMALAYAATAKRGPVAQANARGALNWGVTFALVSTMLLVTHFVLLFAFTADEPVKDFYPLGTAITLYGVIILIHIVVVIVGTVRASQGKVTNIPFAIPFVRR